MDRYGECFMILNAVANLGQCSSAYDHCGFLLRTIISLLYEYYNENALFKLWMKARNFFVFKKNILQTFQPEASHNSMGNITKKLLKMCHKCGTFSVSSTICADILGSKWTCLCDS